MRPRWSIRTKYLVGLGLLFTLVVLLAGAALHSTYAYRGLVKRLSWRASELPLSAELNRHVAETRIILGELRGLQKSGFSDFQPDSTPQRVRMARQHFQAKLDQIDGALAVYREQLTVHRRVRSQIENREHERRTLGEIEEALAVVYDSVRRERWMLERGRMGALDDQVAHLHELTRQLPSHLHTRLTGYSEEVRGRYRIELLVVWVTTATALFIFALLTHLFRRWLFAPLRILIDGSRQMAAGDYDHRIELSTQDEMAELALALNDMTSRFQAIRDDLDRQVRERTKQVVRNEQLASVGFLAAGVAHEINNPLASIALCAESLEERITELLDHPANNARGDSCEDDHDDPCGFDAANDRRAPDDRRGFDGRFDLDDPYGSDDHRDLDGRETLLDNQALDANATDPETEEVDPQRKIVDTYLRMIQDEAFRCKEITEKLLDFSRTGGTERQPVELGELLRGVVEIVGRLGQYQDRNIDVDAPETLVAEVNPRQVKQIVLNLLTNGLDSLSPGGTIWVNLGHRDELAEITFTDDGCGMDPEVREHLFEPFFTRRRHDQGTGLGLAITCRLVSEHGGEIEAESPGPGRGSTFRVRLPIHVESSNPSRGRRVA